MPVHMTTWGGSFIGDNAINVGSLKKAALHLLVPNSMVKTI
jgi:hypothetical protein